MGPLILTQQLIVGGLTHQLETERANSTATEKPTRKGSEVAVSYKKSTVPLPPLNPQDKNKTSSHNNQPPGTNK